jgi:hypothetical protein
MKKKKTTRMTIRQIVREEVAMAIQEVIIELKKPSLSSKEVSQPKSKKKIVEKKSFSKNSIINDVLNETANDGDWKQIGGATYTTERMNELVGGQYDDVMKDSPQSNVNPNDPMSQFLNKDYRGVLQRTEEKQKQKYGK